MGSGQMGSLHECALVVKKSFSLRKYTNLRCLWKTFFPQGRHVFKGFLRGGPAPTSDLKKNAQQKRYVGPLVFDAW
jgi:hypothetical protein